MYILYIHTYMYAYTYTAREGYIERYWNRLMPNEQKVEYIEWMDGLVIPLKLL